MLAFGEGFVTWRPPIDTKAHRHGDQRQARNGNPEIVLNFITPHQKWGIHSTYTDNLLMLTLIARRPVHLDQRGRRQAGRHRRQRLGRSLQRQRRAGGARRGLQRVNPGMALMYHAQEKIMNVPGSEVTGHAAASTTR